MPLDLLEKLLQALSPLCQNAKEFTVEANIENLTPEKCRVLSSYHVNRISLGIQTLQDELLRIIERHHRKEDVEKAISKTQKRIDWLQNIQDKVNTILES